MIGAGWVRVRGSRTPLRSSIRRIQSESSKRVPPLAKRSGPGEQGHQGHSRKSKSIPPYLVLGVGVPAMAITSSLAYIYSSCQDRVPYTNRQRLLATDNAYEIRLGDQQVTQGQGTLASYWWWSFLTKPLSSLAQYKQLLQKYQEDILPPSHRASVTVQRVGGRIAHAAGTFARQWKKSNPEFEYNDAPFTYTVVRSDEANAFVLPGNHVFVLTGLFKYVHNEVRSSLLGINCTSSLVHPHLVIHCIFSSSTLLCTT